MEKQNKEKYGCKKLFFENGFWNRCNGVDKCSECKQSEGGRVGASCQNFI